MESFYNATGGTIYSPGWPGDYGNMLYCGWIIEVPEGNGIRMTFESFRVENDDQCGYDYLLMRHVK